MRVLANKKGFSLVELLTVIAIIAVLAGIIFPVLSLVQKKAQMTKCMTQLHQIGLAVQVFKQDNRKYPDILGTVVRYDDDGKLLPFDRSAGTEGTHPAGTTPPTGLYPEYVKAARLYHCPGSKVTDTSAIVTDYPVNGLNVEMYTYNSYDFYLPAGGTPQPHYSKTWAPTVAAVAPTWSGDTAELRQKDYERQLRFRTPPDSTVITWCSWHETRSATTVTGGKTPTLFLDGHVDSIDGATVESQEWRTMPKTE